MNSEGRIIQHLPRLGYSVAAKEHATAIKFDVYELVNFNSADDLRVKPGDHQPLLYWFRGKKRDLVRYPEQAEVLISGVILPDGSSYWDFEGMARAGSFSALNRHGLQSLGDVMAFCWDWMAELCPTWDPA